MPNTKSTKKNRQTSGASKSASALAHSTNAHHDASVSGKLVPRAGDLGFPIADVAIYQSVSMKGFDDGLDENGGEELSAPISLAQSKSLAQTAPAEGVILTHAQGWYQRGLTLGPLIHSLSLAPGEVTQIAVVEREHTMRGISQDSFSERESVSQRLDQRRAVSQITSSVATEMMFARSSSRSESRQGEAGVGGLAGLFGVSASGGSNSSVATQVNVSAGSKEIAARAKSNIKQHTRQSVAQSSARQSVAIEEVSELSTESFRTRVVANYNHMHALNMQYYEVVQVYDLKTKAIGAERCIFIPMDVIDFTDSDIGIFAPELERAARAAGLTQLAANIAEFEDTGEYNPELVESAINRALLAQRTTIRGVQGRKNRNQQIREHLQREYNRIVVERDQAANNIQTAKDARDMFAREAARTFNQTVAAIPFAAATHSAGIDPAGDPARLRRELLRVTSQLDRGIKMPFGGRMNVTAFGNMHDSFSSTFAQLDQQVEVEESRHADLKRRVINVEGDLAPKLNRLSEEDGDFDARINAAEAATKALEELRDKFGEDYTLVRSKDKLSEDEQRVVASAESLSKSAIAHQLNQRKLYFNQAIWVQMDAAEAASMVAGKTYRGELIAPNFDPTPVAVTGNYVAYRWRFADTREGKAQSRKFDRDYGVADPATAWEPELAEADQVGGPDIDSTISIPTGALFAEAVLGESNAAEKLDLSRFWKWDENTIPIKPTKIDPLRSNPLNTQAPAAAEIPSPTINIQNAPAMPDMPTFAAMSSAMKESTFRDVSGTQTTGEMLAKSMELAAEGSKEAAEKAQENFSTYMDFAEEALPVVAPLVMAAATGGTSLAATGGKMAASELSPTMIGALRNALGSDASDLDPAELISAASKAGLLM